MKTMFCFAMQFLIHVQMPGMSDGSQWSSPEVETRITSMSECEKFTWFGTDEGVVRINKKNNKIQWITTRNSDLPSNQITSIVSAIDGRTWIATNMGMLYWDNYAFIPINSENSNLPDDHITAMALDKAGCLWVGMLRGGLAKTRGFRFTLYSDPNCLPSGESISSISVDRMGIVWVGLCNSGLVRISANTSTRFPKGLNVDVPSNIKFVQLENDGKYLIWTYDQGCYSFDGTTFSHIKDNHADRMKVCNVFRNIQSNLGVWFCEDACYLYKGDMFIEKLANSLSTAPTVLSVTLNLRLTFLAKADTIPPSKS